MAIINKADVVRRFSCLYAVCKVGSGLLMTLLITQYFYHSDAPIGQMAERLMFY